MLGNYSAESGFVAMQKLLQKKRKPSAVFVGNDTVAIAAIAAILRISEDIAVVGYDDIPTAPYLTPALTTIRLSALEHGQKSIAMLEQLMRGTPVPNRKVECHAKLVIRASCGFDQRGFNSP